MSTSVSLRHAYVGLMKFSLSVHEVDAKAQRPAVSLRRTLDRKLQRGHVELKRKQKPRTLFLRGNSSKDLSHQFHGRWEREKNKLIPFGKVYTVFLTRNVADRLLFLRLSYCPTDFPFTGRYKKTHRAGASYSYTRCEVILSTVFDHYFLWADVKWWCENPFWATTGVGCPLGWSRKQPFAGSVVSRTRLERHCRLNTHQSCRPLKWASSFPSRFPDCLHQLPGPVGSRVGSANDIDVGCRSTR